MKKLYLILILATLSCSKEETPTPLIVDTPIDNTLYQSINGTVSTSNSYEIKIYEEFNGTFQQTTVNVYQNSTFPYYFKDKIDGKFYYTVTLHNFSTFTSQGNGVINATIVYKGDTIFIEADENTWSEIITSPTYN